MGVYGVVYAQQDSIRTKIHEDLERALEDVVLDESETENGQLIQYLHDLVANPINVNRADTDQLLGVPGMSLKIAQAIIDYRENEQPFESVEELVNVQGIGATLLGKFRPYLTVSTGWGFSDLYSDYRYWTSGGRFETFSRYQQVLQKQEGYQREASEGGYLGGPGRYYQRLRYHSNHLSLNITQEKDPGETLNAPAQFDYTSWHIALEDNGRLRQLVIGDYDLSFGQGLVLWDGASFGKGREVFGSVNRNERSVSPYSSAQETNGYRGVAGTFGRKIQLTGFYSFRKYTASVIEGDTVRFPRSTGLTQTQNDLEIRNNTGQELYGGRLRIELPVGFVGATGYRTVFDKYIYSGSAAYNQYDFEGIGNSAVGLDYKFVLGPVLIFGEAAQTQNSGFGVVSGLETSIGSRTDFTAAYRNYRKDFQSILGSGFGEISGHPQNEMGIYVGARHSLNKNIILSTYIDQYRFPSPRSGTSQPTAGYDWLALAEIELNPELDFYIQLRSETKEDEYEDFDPYGRQIQRLGTSRRSSIRGQFAYWVNPTTRFRSRGEIVRNKSADDSYEYGYIVYQDLRLIMESKLTIDTRLSMFHTQGFNSRVYQFENDLLYVMSSQMLSGIGQRAYIVAAYKPLDYLQIWAKYGLTVYENEQIIGSGLNQIKGNKRSDIGLQVRLMF